MTVQPSEHGQHVGTTHFNSGFEQAFLCKLIRRTIMIQKAPEALQKRSRITCWPIPRNMVFDLSARQTLAQIGQDGRLTFVARCGCAGSHNCHTNITWKGKDRQGQKEVCRTRETGGGKRRKVGSQATRLLRETAQPSTHGTKVRTEIASELLRSGGRRSERGDATAMAHHRQHQSKFTKSRCQGQGFSSFPQMKPHKPTPSTASGEVVNKLKHIDLFAERKTSLSAPNYISVADGGPTWRHYYDNELVGVELLH